VAVWWYLLLVHPGNGHTANVTPELKKQRGFIAPSIHRLSKGEVE
jgi:hypothetical protein